MENKGIMQVFFAAERERLHHEIIADKATKIKKKGRTKNASRLAFYFDYVNEKLMEAQKADVIEAPKVV
jgi:hypothetical protein